MNGNPKRPPWSQPLCDGCYCKRFNVSSCAAKSQVLSFEYCYDCGKVNRDGIYADIRPKSERRGPRVSDREVKAWVDKNGEYFMAPGSAEGSREAKRMMSAA